MVISPELMALAEYMAGEFDNRSQALADPVWYVHLRLWHRPVPFSRFPEPSLVLFAEQANIVNLNQPYRPRFIQLRQSSDSESSLEDHFLSYDQGIDPGTGKALWGAMLGPFQFQKRCCLAAMLPENLT